MAKAGGVIVTRSTNGSSPASAATARRSRSSSAGECGKSEAVCPSEPMPFSGEVERDAVELARRRAPPPPARRARRGCGAPSGCARAGRAESPARAGSSSDRRPAGPRARRRTRGGRRAATRAGARPRARRRGRRSCRRRGRCGPGADAVWISQPAASRGRVLDDVDPDAVEVTNRHWRARASGPSPPGSRSGTRRGRRPARARGSPRSSCRRAR